SGPAGSTARKLTPLAAWRRRQEFVSKTLRDHRSLPPLKNRVTHRLLRSQTITGTICSRSRAVACELNFGSCHPVNALLSLGVVRTRSTWTTIKNNTHGYRACSQVWASCGGLFLLVGPTGTGFQGA